MKKIIKELVKNKNRNNINGVFEIDNKKIFYKILNNLDFIKEIEGYDIISQYYKTPKQYFKIKNNQRNIRRFYCKIHYFKNKKRR